MLQKRARRAALAPPRRAAGCAASLPTRPSRFQPSRPLSCDADLDARRDEQNGPAHSRADRQRRAQSSVATAPRNDVTQPAPRSRARVDGVESPSFASNVSRRWRVGGVEVPSLQPPIDRSGGTQFATTKGTKQGARASGSRTTKKILKQLKLLKPGAHHQSQPHPDQTPPQREPARCPARSRAAPACRSGGRPCRPRSTRGARRRAGRASPRRR